MKRTQSGFTLIEMAIVLVIIGLLLGGVLKGQELINSAKVKNLATDFKNVPIYIYGYQDKYKALPGDDANVVVHIPSATPASTPAGTLGNGIINGAWNSITQTDESYLFWQHIRLAGFGPGSTDPTNPAAYLPTNTIGGGIGVTNSVTNNPIPTSHSTAGIGLSGTYIVCSNNIPGKFAKQLDTTLDDGNTSTGSVMVAAATAGGAALLNTEVLDDTPYLVCMGY
ncbi:MAG: prepilin-type N-terminal cleavage/methylation domain-containing protein [Gallionella sp.]